MNSMRVEAWLAGRSQTTSPQSICVFVDLDKVDIPDVDEAL